MYYFLALSRVKSIFFLLSLKILCNMGDAKVKTSSQLYSNLIIHQSLLFYNRVMRYVDFTMDLINIVLA